MSSEIEGHALPNREGVKYAVSLAPSGTQPCAFTPLKNRRADGSLIRGRRRPAPRRERADRPGGHAGICQQ